MTQISNETDSTQTEKKLSKAAFLQAMVLDNLSHSAHEQSNMLMDLGQTELMSAYMATSGQLFAAARELFPLYPHPDFTSQAVQDWLRENNIEGFRKL